MPGTSDVEVRQSKIPGGGRGVFAKKSFAPGDAVIIMSRPLIAELDHDRLFDTCAWCCSRAATDPHERASSQQMNLPAGFIEVKACTGCKKIKYCSKQCQAKAWKAEHKYECKVLADPARPPLPHGVRATVKLLKRFEAGDAAVKDILKFQPKFDDVKKTDPEKYEEFCTLAYGAWKYAGEPANAELARMLFFAMMCNVLTLSTPLDDIELGIGFDPLLCSVNHSCEPNTVFLFNTPQVVMRARRPIKAGDEITIKYREINNPYSVRQGELKEWYFFDCRCDKCQKGATLAEDAFTKPIDQLPSAWCKRADDLIEKQKAKKLDVSWYVVGDNATQAEKRMTALQAEAFQVWSTSRMTPNKYLGSKAGTTMDDLNAALRICLDSGMWSLTRQPVPYILRAIWADHVAKGEMQKALHLGMKRYFCIDPKLVREPFERVVDTFAMGQVTTTFSHPMNQQAAQELAKEGCDTRMLFLGLLTEAWDNLPKSYGRDSQLGKVVTKIWRTCVGERDDLQPAYRKQIEEAWPKLKLYAEKIDVLKI